MAKSSENFESHLHDYWANEDVEKSLGEAVDRYVKQGEERKTRFFIQSNLY